MDRILIYRVGYVVAFLLISLPVSAYYHGHSCWFLIDVDIDTFG